MENPLRSPATSLPTEPRRRPRLLRRVLLTLLVVAGVLGAVLLALPAERPVTRAPAPGPTPGTTLGAAALTTVGAGAPASPAGPETLIAERERHLRAQPRDARAWAVLGAAHVEQGRRTAGAARRYPGKALRTNPYFSPPAVPQAWAALQVLGEPSVAEAPESVTGQERR
jgi:cytochrome c-type biogenesis protein CcmH/NrfG